LLRADGFGVYIPKYYLDIRDFGLSLSRHIHTGGYTGVANAILDAQFGSFLSHMRSDQMHFFDLSAPVYISRAPGRMDVMGGVGDYSGCIVLEGTIAESTFTAVQRNFSRTIRVQSDGAGAEGLLELAEYPLDRLLDNGIAVPMDQASAFFRENEKTRWGAYIAGCLYMLALSGWLPAEEMCGVNILVQSDVPIGAGVASSAALEVSAMHAMCGLFGIQMDGLELAKLCQMVENRVVGAPCGVMDQVTCALGKENALLALKCQPHDILGYQRIPKGWRFIGLDSRVKHSVAGHNYTRARVGTFMGLKVLQTLSHEKWGGYLGSVSVDVWNIWRSAIPEIMTGAEFLARFGDYPDPVTRVDPGQSYRVRDCAEHPILENDRVKQFIALMNLASDEPDDMLMKEVGLLMLDANDSGSYRIQFGSPETDLLVDLAMNAGPPKGVYGAKITGGGSGGVVVMLCRDDMVGEVIEEIQKEYLAQTGIKSRMLTGSSPGAMDWGIRIVEMDESITEEARNSFV
jgi:L-arabinokinase